MEYPRGIFANSPGIVMESQIIRQIEDHGESHLDSQNISFLDEVAFWTSQMGLSSTMLTMFIQDGPEEKMKQQRSTGISFIDDEAYAQAECVAGIL